jgi:hypothetical protein
MSMNFLEVTIRWEGTAWLVEAPGLRIGVPPQTGRALASWRDKSVTLGVRPEHLCLGNGQPQHSFDAVIEVLEARLLGEVGNRFQR